jgi:hypothetical protein
LCKQLSFHSFYVSSLLSPFCRICIFPWEHENIWNWGRSLKIHIEIRKGVVYVFTTCYCEVWVQLFGNFVEHFLVWTCHNEQESLFCSFVKLCKRKENRMLLM